MNTGSTVQYVPIPGRYRWIGFVFFGCMIAAILGIGAAVEFTDVVVADIRLTTPAPPIPIVAAESGQLRFAPQVLEAVGSKDLRVDEGELLGRISSAALPEDIELAVEDAESCLEFLASPTSGEAPTLKSGTRLQLGPMEVEHAELVVEMERLMYFRRHWRPFIESQREELTHRLSLQNSVDDKKKNNLKRILSEEVGELKEQVSIAARRVRMQQDLINRGAGSTIAMANARQGLISANVLLLDASARQMELSVKTSEQKYDLAQLIEATDREGMEKEQNLYRSAHRLLASVRTWKSKFELRSPTSGLLATEQRVESERFVEAGEQLLSLVPEAHGILGRAFVTDGGVGRIRRGQMVIVKLNDYPYRDFGAVHGSVRSVSLVPVGNQHVVHVDFADELITTHGVKAKFVYDMQGSAEIVIEQRNLLRLVVDRLRSMTD